MSKIPKHIRTLTVELIEVDDIPECDRELALDYLKVWSAKPGLHQFGISFNHKVVFTKDFVESFYSDFMPFYNGIMPPPAE